MFNVQAIKFRGLNTISPNSSVRCKRAAVAATVASSAVLKKGSTSSATLVTTTSSPACSATVSQRPNCNHPCYQTSSLNENSAKKLCRKQPHALIAHTETQLVRSGVSLKYKNNAVTESWTKQQSTVNMILMVATVGLKDSLSCRLGLTRQA